MRTGGSDAPGRTRRLQVEIFVVRLEVVKLRIRSLGVRITPTQQFPQEPNCLGFKSHLGGTRSVSGVVAHRHAQRPVGRPLTLRL